MGDIKNRMTIESICRNKSVALQGIDNRKYLEMLSLPALDGVTIAKYQTISIEIVGTCMYLCLTYICIRNTALYFSLSMNTILRVRCVNPSRCRVRTDIKVRTIDGQSERSRYTRESTSRSASFSFSEKKI